MVACSQPAVDLLGVSTVACNQSVDKTTANAISVLHACGHGNVPVAQGAPKPLMREHVDCAEIHGDSGLDACSGGRLFPLVDVGPSLPRAALAISDAIRIVRDEGRGPLQLVCTGALTNAALAFMLFPELADRTHVEVTLMGGAMGIGNTGAVQVRQAFPPTPRTHVAPCIHSMHLQPQPPSFERYSRKV
jgi:inosine-uridine nucleoside N-ribohydrolase